MEWTLSKPFLPESVGQLAVRLLVPPSSGALALTLAGGTAANLVEHSAVRDARLWSKDEDALLLDIVSRGQPPAPRWSWRLVADQIEGKSSGAVSKHWYKVFKPKCTALLSFLLA